MSKTGTFGLHGNDYEVDAELAGHKIELVFDPLDLTELEVRTGAGTVGRAIPLTIRRHVHPKARVEAEVQRPAATGIDYLGLIAARRSSGARAADRLSQPAARPAARTREATGGIDRLQSALGVLQDAVHQGAGTVDAVRVPLPSGSGRADQLDHLRARAGCRLRRGRRREDRRRPRSDRRDRPEPAHADLPPQPGDRPARSARRDRPRAR